MIPFPVAAPVTFPFLLAFLLAFLFAHPLPARSEAAPRKTSLGLATASAGTWTAYGELDGFMPGSYSAYGNGLRRYEFNKLAVLGFYGMVLGQPAFLSLPWLWTAKRGEKGSEHRIAPGDGEMYVGQRLGAAEARLGLIVPAGYDTRDGDPWIGPGNIQVTLGAAVNPNLTRYSRRWEMSAEGKWAYTLDDAIAKSGSWALYPGGKISFRPAQQWKSGLEGLGYWKRSYWGRSAGFGQSVLGRAGPKAQWGAGFVPSLFVEDFLNGNVAVGLKAGHGLWGYRDAATYNASVYLLYFP